MTKNYGKNWFALLFFCELFLLTFLSGLKIYVLTEVVAEFRKKYLIVENWLDQIEKL